MLLKINVFDKKKIKKIHRARCLIEADAENIAESDWESVHYPLRCDRPINSAELFITV
jgi:hypothetical protein